MSACEVYLYQLDMLIGLVLSIDKGISLAEVQFCWNFR
jgi:hypothetical protein